MSDQRPDRVPLAAMTGRRLAAALVATALVFGGLGAGLTLLVTGDDRETAAAPERTVTSEQEPAEIAVHDLTGLPLAVALKQAQAAGFTTTVVARATTQAPRGTIVDQMPAAGTTQRRGSALTLVVAQHT